MHTLRFRQVHLDFHTSEAIQEIGSRFDKKQFQEALQTGRVDSVTCFAKCHHGWSYYRSDVAPMHPHLSFDLLRAQYEACKEIDVNVPIYLSAGFDEAIAHQHRDWLQNFVDENIRAYHAPLKPRFRLFCFHSPYLDYLCRQIEEVVTLFPNCDGIFLDIIVQHQCVCSYCLDFMHSQGLDATDESARKACAQAALERYYQRTSEAAKSRNADMPVFHNSGHIARGNREVLKHFSHLELESLPTGGWGYDHFPLSAKYCSNLPLDMLGMTGKFHTTWGEFGGYKHPNALKYECAAMLAYGAKCSIGDQLHPLGDMNTSTYNLIGHAYRHVEQCEPYCHDAKTIADIALFSAQSQLSGNRHAGDDPDIGATRILLEGHFLFDVIDAQMDFSQYKLIILPDIITVDPPLKAKLDTYLSGGGKLMLTGQSGLDENGEGLFDIGATFHGPSEFCPDYILGAESIRPDFIDDPIVMYVRSQRIKAGQGQSLGKVYDPYFNRAYNHFCSHQHTPNLPQASDYDCGVMKNNMLYLAHPVFTLYRGMGAVAYRYYITNALKLLLERPGLETNLPSTARVSLMDQENENRLVLHLLYANTINRGGPMTLEGGTLSGQSKSIEIIEEFNPLHNLRIELRTEKEITSATLQPQNLALAYENRGDGIAFTIDTFTCHQMIVLNYA